MIKIAVKFNNDQPEAEKYFQQCPLGDFTSCTHCLCKLSHVDIDITKFEKRTNIILFLDNL